MESDFESIHSSLLHLQMHLINPNPPTSDLQMLSHLGLATGYCTHLKSLLYCASEGLDIIPKDLSQRFKLHTRDLRSISQRQTSDSPESLTEYVRLMSDHSRRHLQSVQDLLDKDVVNRGKIPAGKVCAFLNHVRLLHALPASIVLASCHSDTFKVPIQLYIRQLEKAKYNILSPVLRSKPQADWALPLNLMKAAYHRRIFPRRLWPFR